MSYERSMASAGKLATAGIIMPGLTIYDKIVRENTTKHQQLLAKVGLQRGW
jgi:hypothetical protein